jgi:hypothetical protein
MYVSSAYGDYPHYLPGENGDDSDNRFTGWMLLSYKKKVVASSVANNLTMKIIDSSKEGWMLPQEKQNFKPENVTDENIRTAWLAQTNGKNEWLEIDLEELMKIYSLQVNFQDVNSKIFGKPDSLFHQFIIEHSIDGKNWFLTSDKSQNMRDQPDAYIELMKPISARYIRYRNIHVPTTNLAISGFRIFGKGSGDVPGKPDSIIVKREVDKRNAYVSWKSIENATGYTLYWGINKDFLNNSLMVYGESYINLRALNVDQDYFFAVEAFNQNGVSEKAWAE